MVALDVGSSKKKTIKSAGFQKKFENLGYSKKTKVRFEPEFTNSPHVQKPAIFRYKRCIRDRKAQFAFRREQSNTLKMGRL